MDPRIRARRVEVTRAAGRRRLRNLAAGLGLIGLATASFGVVHSPILGVRHVEVRGAGHTPVAEVLAAVHLQRGHPMVDVNTASLGRRLAALPWVASASVSRHWPSTVDIRLHERTPVAVVPAAGGQTAVVDQTGRVLAVGPSAAAVGSGLPTVKGLDAPPAAGVTIGPEMPAHAALGVAASLPASLRPRLADITVTNGGEVDAAVGSTVVFIGSPADLPAKFLALTTLLQRVDLKGVAVIDLRVPAAPVLTHG
jgi:cell division protein FtsQ